MCLILSSKNTNSIMLTLISVEVFQLNTYRFSVYARVIVMIIFYVEQNQTFIRVLINNNKMD